MTVLLEIAGIAGVLARDLLPPDRSVTRRALLRIVGHRWQDRKALGESPASTTNRRAVHLLARRPPGPKRRAHLYVAMYDAVTVADIPDGALAVAGYVNGRYVTVAELDARFPHAHLLTIAVNAGANAECLDVETGDATPEQAPGWVARQHARGARRPCVYANRSTMPRVWALLEQAGIKRNDVRLWVADWTGEPHIPAGYDACQWHGGQTVAYDESLCSPSFFS